MDQSDLERLAHQFMIDTVEVQPTENIWIEYIGEKAKLLASACGAKVEEASGRPFMIDSGSAAINDKIRPLSLEQIQNLGHERLATMRTMQGYIRIKDDADEEKIDLPAHQLALYKKALQPMTEYRVNHTRWLVVAAPTSEFASACEMALADFERFYLDVCLTDYKNMSEAVKPLEKIMTDGNTVRIYSSQQETDLSFSIQGLPGIPCTGQRNIPDGECYTAPVKNSVTGHIRFGPSSYNGQRFEFIKLTFSHGRVERAEAETSERTDKLNEILDSDEGARYVGEFSINFNPFIQYPTGSILFDEKIAGGIHMAVGNCYENAPNGNRSVVHWDMVHIQRPEFGGGELYIDGRLIRKDGIFVVPELEPLNPENLKVSTAGQLA